MNHRIQTREILAWMTLALAFILFSVTIAFAQTKSISVDRDDGKVHVKISKTENGETIKIDTTFDATDDTNVDAIIERLSNSDGSESHWKSDNNGKHKQMHIMIDSDYPQLSDAQKEKLHEEWRESMKDMRKGIDDMKKSLKSMHVQVESDGDADSGAVNDFHFHFDSPDEETNDRSNCDDFSYSYKYSYNGSDEADSMKDKNHIVIVGSEDEKPPVLEKVVTSKNGKQIFVYKRSKSTKPSAKTEMEKESENQKAEKPDVHNLRYYPNPTSGKFKLYFRTDKSDDFNIQILDDNSKTIFTEKLNDFSGEYSKEIDISSKSKGNYFLKITQGDKSITKKIILN